MPRYPLSFSSFVAAGLATSLTLSFALVPQSAEAKQGRAPSSKLSKAGSKAAAKTKNENSLSEGDSGPIDELQEQLYSVYKNKKAVRIKLAFDALDAGKFETAKKSASTLLSDPQFGDYARWIAAQCDLREGRAALSKGATAEARKYAQSALALISPISIRYPYSPFIKSLPRQLSSAEAVLARSLCEAKKYDACKSSFENAFERVMSTPDMAWVRPDDLSAYAQACSKKKTELCLSWVQRLAAYYSKSTEEFKAIAQVFPSYRERVPRAPTVAKITQSYRAPDLDQVAIDQAMQLYLDGKNKDAIEALRRFTDEFPRSSARFRARYWLAQALKKNGKGDEAKQLLTDLQKTSPLTYYGLLAGIEIGSTPQTLMNPDPPTGTDFDPFLTPLEVFKLRRAQNLLAAKAYNLAAMELRDFKARDGLSSHFLVYLAMLHSEAKSWVSAFTILNELIARGHTGVFSEYFAAQIFPVHPMTEVKKFADDVKIDPVLVLSLIKQESSFDPTASSVSGALGLMQIMPTTAVDTVSGLPRHELLSPESNLKTGTLYLSRLLNRFQGNMVYATASYNAGPGAVNRWIKSAPQGRPMLEFIESIPYKETREYVSAIIRNYFWYTQRLNPESASKLNLDFFWHNYGPQPLISSEPKASDAKTADDDEDDKPSPVVTPTPTPTPTPAAVLSPNPTSTPAPTATPAPTPSL